MGGVSKDSLVKGANFAAVTAAIVVLSTVPGFNILQLGGMIVDVIDPYGYSTTLTREAIDTYSKQAVSSVNDVTQSVEAQTKIAQEIESSSPSLTQEEKDTALAIAISQWHEYDLQPQEFSSCFEDYVNPLPTGDKSFSGSPTSNCDMTYASFYKSFVSSNKAKYEQNEIDNGTELIKIVNDTGLAFTQIDLENKKTEYLQFIYIMTL